MRLWAHNDYPHSVYISHYKLVHSIVDPTIILFPENPTQRVPKGPKYTQIYILNNSDVANTSKSVAHFPTLFILILLTQSCIFL